MMTEIVRPFAPREGLVGRVAGRRRELATDRVYLLFTTLEETLSAIPVAGRLARALHTRLTVVHFRTVGFGAALESPCGLSPLESEEFKTRLEVENCEAEATVCLCRDARTALSKVLGDRSLVVLGRHRHWWRTPADRLRRTLEGAGHLVVVVDEQTHA